MTVMRLILEGAWLAVGILAAALAALALLGLGVLGLLALIDRVGVWLDEHPEEGRKHEK